MTDPLLTLPECPPCLAWDELERDGHAPAVASWDDEKGGVIVDPCASGLYGFAVWRQDDPRRYWLRECQSPEELVREVGRTFPPGDTWQTLRDSAASRLRRQS